MKNIDKTEVSKCYMGMTLVVAVNNRSHVSLNMNKSLGESTVN